MPGCELFRSTSPGVATLPRFSSGTNQIVVDYSGDAVSESSASPPVDVVVTSTPRSSRTTGDTRTWSRVPRSVGQARRSHISTSPPTRPFCRNCRTSHTSTPGWSVHSPSSTCTNRGRTRCRLGETQQVLADGAIPMIDWRCGDTDANIIAGSDDGLITAEAKSAGGPQGAGLPPVVLRTQLHRLGELLPTASATWVQRATGRPSATSMISSQLPVLPTSPSSTQWRSSGNDQDLYEYYPGSSYVDWIAVDGYSKTSLPPTTDFVDRFSPWYSDFAAFGKPMMISETGSFAGGQASYFQQIEDPVVVVRGLSHSSRRSCTSTRRAKAGRFTYPLDSAGLAGIPKPVCEPDVPAVTVGLDRGGERVTGLHDRRTPCAPSTLRCPTPTSVVH